MTSVGCLLLPLLLLTLVGAEVAVKWWMLSDVGRAAGAPPLSPSRTATEREYSRLSKEWRSVVADRRARRNAAARAKRVVDYQLVRQDFPAWLVRLGENFGLHAYDDYLELGRFMLTTLRYAEINFAGHLPVRKSWQHAPQIMAVQNRTLYSREFFEALGQALVEQGLLTGSAGRRARQLAPDAMERLEKQLPLSFVGCLASGLSDRLPLPTDKIAPTHH